MKALRSELRVVLSALSISLSLSLFLLFGHIAWAQGEVRHVQGDIRNPITFGLEIEMNLDRHPGSPQLLRFYRPNLILAPQKELVPISDEEWSKLPAEGRLELAIESNQLAGRKAKSPSGESVKFVLMDMRMTPLDPENASHQRFYSHLPQQLYREGTGNLELEGFVFKELEEVGDFLEIFQGIIGEGDVQGHVVFNEKPLPGVTGYSLYEHDRALLRRLEEEHGQYKEDPSRLPAINFISRFLPPFGSHHRNQLLQLEKVLEGSGQGEDGQSKMAEFAQTQLAKDLQLSQAAYPDKVRVQRVSAPALRTLSYPTGKIGLELRMEDNPSENPHIYEGSFGRLLSSMDRLSLVMQRDGQLKIFKEFNEVELPQDFKHPLTGANAAELKIMLELPPEFLPPQSNPHKWAADLKALYSTYFQGTLKKLKKALSLAEGSSLTRMLETKLGQKVLYENYFAFESQQGSLSKFLFPLRDWSHYPLLKVLPARELSELRTKLSKAALTYLQRLVELLGTSPSLKGEDIIIGLRKALGEWAQQVQLYALFEKWEEKAQINSPDAGAEVFPRSSIMGKCRHLRKKSY